jgi:hypothetical protein
MSSAIDCPGLHHSQGPDGTAEAATCIQKHVRGHLTRRRCLYGDLIFKAVIPIQRAWRLYLTYQDTKLRIEERLCVPPPPYN